MNEEHVCSLTASMHLAKPGQGHSKEAWPLLTLCQSLSDQVTDHMCFGEVLI